MFIAELFTAAKKQKQLKYSSVDKMWYIYTRAYYAAIKRMKYIIGMNTENRVIERSPNKRLCVILRFHMYEMSRKGKYIVRKKKKKRKQ